MKQIKLVSLHGKDCKSHYFRRDEDGKIVKGGAKVLKKGWGMYCEITVLPNGKKVSVTKHGPLPEGA